MLRQISGRLAGRFITCRESSVKLSGGFVRLFEHRDLSGKIVVTMLYSERATAFRKRPVVAEVNLTLPHVGLRFDQ